MRDGFVSTLGFGLLQTENCYRISHQSANSTANASSHQTSTVSLRRSAMLFAPRSSPDLARRLGSDRLGSDRLDITGLDMDRLDISRSRAGAGPYQGSRSCADRPSSNTVRPHLPDVLAKPSRIDSRRPARRIIQRMTFCSAIGSGFRTTASQQSRDVRPKRRDHAERVFLQSGTLTDKRYRRTDHQRQGYADFEMLLPVE